MKKDFLSYVLSDFVVILRSLQETRSFSLTAKKLNLSQPVISQKILDMERGIGVSLVDRSHRPIDLTFEGKQLLREISGITNSLPDFFNEIRRKNSAKLPLSIGIIETLNYNITPLLLKRLTDYVNGLYSFSGTSDQLIEVFNKNEIDNIIVSDVNSQLTNVRRTTLFSEPTVLALPKQFQCEKELWTWSRLKFCGLPGITLSPRSGGGKLSESFFALNGFHFKNLLQVDNSGLQLRLVADGFGWSLVRPAAVIQHCDLIHDLALFPMPHPLMVRNVYLISRSSVPLELHSAISGHVKDIWNTVLLVKILETCPWLEKLSLLKKK